jgi:murein L,D-transpeptidase YafK
MRYVILVLATMLFQQSSFKSTQLKNSRVKTAYDEKEAVVKKYFEDKKLAFKGFNVFFRAFKKEMKFEVWVKEQGKPTFALLHTYDICSSSGELGPKRKEGDYQVPEGVYHINHFNPQSNFYLSLGISYPNDSDRVLSDKKAPGSAIYVHGNCVTIGCIPLTDDKIKELYVLAVEARNNGQQQIPIHIFPSHLDNSSLTTIEKEFQAHAAFWKNLQPIYLDFENNKKLKKVTVNKKGEYQLQ